MGVKELWIKYSTGIKSRYIPIHTLGQKLGEGVCSKTLNIHVLTGCDSTSKIGTKAAALKANYHLINNFRKNREPDIVSLKQVEKYLFSVLYLKEKCDTFDDLGYIFHTKKKNPIIFTTYF